MKILQNLEKSYCLIDDFVKLIQKNQLFKSLENRGRKSVLSISELILLGLLRMDLKIESIKDFHQFIKISCSEHFPKLPSYQQFCDGLNKAFPYLTMILQIFLQLHKQNSDDFFIVDSSALPICSSILRKNRVKRDGGFGKIGKNLNGFYFGFKLHAVINRHMQYVSLRITPANHSDLSVLDEKFLKGIRGMLVGDKGYISAEKTVDLKKMDIELITKPRKNMKKLPVNKKAAKVISKRYKIETSFSLLKQQFLLISRFARSFKSFLSQIIFSIIAYSMQKVNFNAFKCDSSSLTFIS